MRNKVQVYVGLCSESGQVLVRHSGIADLVAAPVVHDSRSVTNNTATKLAHGCGLTLVNQLPGTFVRWDNPATDPVMMLMYTAEGIPVHGTFQSWLSRERADVDRLRLMGVIGTPC